MLTWALARRLAGTGVTANALHPGFVASEIFAKGGGLLALAASKRSTPSSRPARPEEGADTAVWLGGEPRRRQPQRALLDRPPGAPLPLPRRVRRGGPVVALPGDLICWDQWYPEGARLTALPGAQQCSSLPTAIGWHPHEKEIHGRGQHNTWRTIQRSHAIANGVYAGPVVDRLATVPPEGRPGPGVLGLRPSFVADPFRPRRSPRRPVDAEQIPDRRRGTSAASRRSAATGPSSGTAASTPTREWTGGSSIDPGLPHARRVGAPRGHLARLAAPTSPTGRGASRPIPWVYGEIVRKLAPGEIGSASSCPRRLTRRGRDGSWRVGGGPGPGRALPLPHRPRLDARLRAVSCAARPPRAEVAVARFASAPGQAIDESTWALTSYLVANAIILPLAGWLSHQFGRKRLLMLSVSGFTVASVRSLAPSLPFLILFRVIQGMTGGALQHLSQAVLLEAFPRAARQGHGLLGPRHRGGAHLRPRARGLADRRLQALALGLLHQPAGGHRGARDDEAVRLRSRLHREARGARGLDGDRPPRPRHRRAPDLPRQGPGGRLVRLAPDDRPRHRLRRRPRCLPGPRAAGRTPGRGPARLPPPRTRRASSSSRW